MEQHQFISDNMNQNQRNPVDIDLSATDLKIFSHFVV